MIVWINCEYNIFDKFVDLLRFSRVIWRVASKSKLIPQNKSYCSSFVYVAFPWGTFNVTPSDSVFIFGKSNKKVTVTKTVMYNVTVTVISRKRQMNERITVLKSCFLPFIVTIIVRNKVLFWNLNDFTNSLSQTTLFLRYNFPL